MERRRSAPKWKPTAKALRRPVIAVKHVLPRPKGLCVRLLLQDEAPTIGSGQRLVLCQFRGKKVMVHHAGYTQAIKRDLFKEFQQAVSSTERAPEASANRQ
jgi:hypothetical protein